VAEKLQERAFLVVFLFALTVIEALRWIFGVKPSPWTFLFFLLCFLGSLAYAFSRRSSARKEIHALKVGYAGEKFVGQFLEDMRREGCRVYHDIQGDGFNIDHVLVSRKGVFTIETKSVCKGKGQCIVEYSGDSLLINGRKPDRDPLVQAKAQAKWFREQLSGMTGKNFDVKPVIIYAGWFVQKTHPAAQNEVWVLHEAAFRKYYNYRPDFLTEVDVSSLDYWICRFIRYGSGGLGGGK